MTSVVVLSCVLALLVAAMRLSRPMWLRYAIMFVLSALVVEASVFGLFLVQIGRATCFFLIGQEQSLDALIRMRLSYAVYFAQGKKNFINRVDEDSGYSLGKDKDTGTYQTNLQGFRAQREYTLFPDEDHLRVVALGDSLVFCDDERNQDAWPHVLEGASEHLEVLNFGVPGYGLGQSYLRYLKYAREYHPDIIFINYVRLTDRDKIARRKIVDIDDLRMAHFYRVHFWVENGILKSRSMTPYDLLDPAFRKNYLLDEGKIFDDAGWGFLEHLNFCNTGILLKARAMAHLTRKMKMEENSADDGSVEYAILSNFLETARRDGSQVIFFYGSDFSGLPSHIQELFEANASFVTYVDSRKSMEEVVTAHDAQDHELHNASGHYNAEGNRYYAEAVHKILKSRAWCRPAKCFQL